MTGYQLWLFVHVVGVIAWLGTGTTLALIGLYADRTGDGLVASRLGPLTAWLAPRVFAPASLGTLASGIVLVHDADMPARLWLELGALAVAASILLNVAVRLPVLRRSRSGALDPSGAARTLRWLAVVELTVLYLAVADMIARPTGVDATTAAVGGGVLAPVALVAAAVAVRARRAARHAPVRAD